MSIFKKLIFGKKQQICLLLFHLMNYELSEQTQQDLDELVRESCNKLLDQGCHINHKVLEQCSSEEIKYQLALAREKIQNTTMTKYQKDLSDIIIYGFGIIIEKYIDYFKESNKNDDDIVLDIEI
jgi:hypothetical protein